MGVVGTDLTAAGGVQRPLKKVMGVSPTYFVSHTPLSTIVARTTVALVFLYTKHIRFIQVSGVVGCSWVQVGAPAKISQITPDWT